VGLLATTFVVSVFRSDPRRWMRSAASGAFALILAQGILGGLRVRMDDRSLAMVHACFGLATFAYLAAMVVVTSRYWTESERRLAVVSNVSQRLQRLSLLTAGMVYVQVVLGAMLRHTPVGASHQFFRIAVIFHLLLAAAVTLHAVLLALAVRRDYRHEPRLTRPVIMLLSLVGLQLCLGIGTWVLKYGWPSWFSELSFTAGHTIEANGFLQGVVTTAHMAVGALILSQSVVFMLRAARFFRPGTISAGSGALLMGWTA
jgi:cytochrome c oxidase assembly protein subunit 15